MPDFDIEKYILGKMSSAEKRAMDEELEKNIDFAHEVNLAKQLAEDIDMQSMRKEVRSIMKKGKPPGKNKNGKWLIVLTALVTIGVVLFFFTNDESEASPDSPLKKQNIPPVEKQKSKLENIPEENILTENKSKKKPPVKKKKKQRKPTPIANNDSQKNIAPPLFPSPKLRGQNKENEAWKKMLDQVWYTKFPPENNAFSEPYTEAAQLLTERKFTRAFSKLEILGFKVPENDTLSFLKGYCLTEMGEGADAIRHFDNLKNTPDNWKPYIEWHRALSVLSSEGIAAALPYFEKIKKEENHIFQKESAHVIKLLQDNF